MTRRQLLSVLLIPFVSALTVLAIDLLAPARAGWEYWLTELPAPPRTPIMRFDQLQERYGVGRNLDKQKVRNLYNCLIHSVAADDVLSYYQSASPDDTCLWARGMHQYRAQVRAYVRERGTWLDETLVRARDVLKYGWARTNGPLFADLFAKFIRKGYTNNTEICQQILDSAQRTSADWNKYVGIDSTDDDSCLTTDQRTRIKRVHRILFAAQPDVPPSSIQALTYLDAHYSVNGSKPIRVRMNSVKDAPLGQYECCQVKLTSRDTVAYWFSYGGSIDGQDVECETPSTNYPVVFPMPSLAQPSSPKCPLAFTHSLSNTALTVPLSTVPGLAPPP